MFSFSSGLSSGSNTICYRLFFSAIELLWDRWQISTDHKCTDFLLDSLFCSVNHLICLLFHQGHAVLILVASFVVVQLPSHVYCLPHHELHHARLPCLSLFPEFAQTHVQSPNPLSHPSPLALILSQHQGLFKWVNPSHQVAKVLEWVASAFSDTLNMHSFLHVNHTSKKLFKRKRNVAINIFSFWIATFC